MEGVLGRIWPLLEGLRCRVFFLSPPPPPIRDDDEVEGPVLSSSRLSESDDDEDEVEKLKCCFSGEESAGTVDSIANGDIVTADLDVRATVEVLGENNKICSRAEPAGLRIKGGDALRRLSRRDDEDEDGSEEEMLRWSIVILSFL